MIAAGSAQLVIGELSRMEGTAMPDPNRFLHGPFAPVEEEITAFDLPVTGSLPEIGRAHV